MGNRQLFGNKDCPTTFKIMLHNYKKAPDYKVREWIEKSIPDLTPYQKRKMLEDEVIRFAPFEFMERRKRASSFWLRLTVIFMPWVWLVLFLWLPFNFVIKGSWGYKYNTMKWFDTWRNNVGL